MKPQSYLSITIAGTVQGVGFRPFVYRTAKAFGISGDVKNDITGVVIRASGSKSSLDDFINAIKQNAPPLASIRSIDIVDLPLLELPGPFTIAQSGRGQNAEIDIARDTAVCPSCLAEMLDKNNRRYRHPFINCTDCGPRYTIIKNLPYDRPATTMAPFDICDTCRSEYEDPSNRRFHAQPVCCNDCGPKLVLIDGAEKQLAKDNMVEKTVDMLLAGKIIAIKGIGGFHLACLAGNDAAVAMLRRKKKREEKPFALMVKDTDAALRYVHISAQEKTMLESPERPIVILEKRDACAGISPHVARGLPTLGIMLPYTPVHHLLFVDNKIKALVMTSANMRDEPIIYGDAQAAESLAHIADAFLTHNRAIYMRNDDSIVRIIANSPVIVRRSRGFVPSPLPAQSDITGIVALGGVLKSTVAIGRNNQCYMSQYIGSVSTIEDLDNMAFAVSHLLQALFVKPELYVCDMHPQSLINGYAQKTGLPVVSVQHHHAHAAACMAENEINHEALCIVFDGTGFGDDGTIWGGEILHATYTGYTRLGHLSHLLLPGGDEAIRNPGRIAWAALQNRESAAKLDLLQDMAITEKQAVTEMIQAGVNCPKSSSMGRLFDAVSALCGVCTKRTYEGQPAIELEGCADTHEQGEYAATVRDSADGIIIDAENILDAVCYDMSNGFAIPVIAARFHNTIARATAVAAKMAEKKCGCKTVCLSGGVFQNALLVRRLLPLLKKEGLVPVRHQRTPPNDECISYGQAVIAGAKRT